MKIILLLFVFVFTSYAAIDNAEQIIEKFSKLKGLDEVQNLQDIKISGKNIDGPLSYEFNYYFLKPNFHRLDIKSKEVSFKMVWDGKNGFAKTSNFPAQELATLDIVTIISLNESIISPIYEHQKNNYKFSFDGIVDNQGVKCFKILKTEKNGIVTDLLIDTANYYLKERIRLFEEYKETVLSKITYENYTEFKGIKIPKKISIYFNDLPRIFLIDSVMFNIGLVPFDFRKPS